MPILLLSVLGGRQTLNSVLVSLDVVAGSGNCIELRES